MTNLRATLGLAVATLMLVSACAGRKGPPDPAKVQQKMTATLDGEKELIRTTVASAERGVDRSRRLVVALLRQLDLGILRENCHQAQYEARCRRMVAGWRLVRGRDRWPDRFDYWNGSTSRWGDPSSATVRITNSESADSWPPTTQAGKTQTPDDSRKLCGTVFLKKPNRF